MRSLSADKMSLFEIGPSRVVNDAGLCGTRLTQEQIENARDLRICHLVEHAFEGANGLPEGVRVKVEALRAQVESGTMDETARRHARSEVEQAIMRAHVEKFDNIRAIMLAPADLSEMQMIVPGVYISSQYAALNRNTLQAEGITHVCMCMEFSPPYPDQFQYLALKVYDVPTQEIKSRFVESYEFIYKAHSTPGTKTLIHCAMGISRSSTIATAYLMRRYGLTAPEALAMIRHARPYVAPNEGFAKQLVLYEQELRELGIIKRASSNGRGTG